VTTDFAKHGVNVNLGGRDRGFKARQSLPVQTSAVLLGPMLERLVDDGRNILERYGYHVITISQPFRLSIWTSPMTCPDSLLESEPAPQAKCQKCRRHKDQIHRPVRILYS
jgi:hypothetical protein